MNKFLNNNNNNNKSLSEALWLITFFSFYFPVFLELFNGHVLPLESEEK